MEKREHKKLMGNKRWEILRKQGERSTGIQTAKEEKENEHGETIRGQTNIGESEDRKSYWEGKLKEMKQHYKRKERRKTN